MTIYMIAFIALIVVLTMFEFSIILFLSIIFGAVLLIVLLNIKILLNMDGAA